MKLYIKWLLSISSILWTVQVTQAQKRVCYDLYVRDTVVNHTGKNKHAIAVNGQIPMPELTFYEGDTAEIRVHNELKVPTALHWHGLFLPNKEDGVPYLTQMPIPPGGEHTYSFPLIQHGTHWYHSHYGLQEQIGMYGSFTILKREDDPSFRPDIDDLPVRSLILSEWTDIKPMQVQRILHTGNDWFSIRKKAVQSYGEAAVAGKLGVKLHNEWKRMEAMDLSDVYYDKVMINGRETGSWEGTQGQQPFRAGDRVRLRIANGGASSYFWLRYAGGPITVVASDGNDVKPVEVDRLLIGVSETYDIVLTVPKSGMAYEFEATTEDRTRKASLYIGKGHRMPLVPLARLRYFEGMKMMNRMMKMDGTMKDMGMHMSLNKMDMNKVMYPEVHKPEAAGKPPVAMSMHQGHTMPDMPAAGGIRTLNYTMLQAPEATVLPEGSTRTLHFNLTGNMNRYVWSMDNKVISEADRVLVRKGEKLRLILHNQSMMRHPMHLHGHDFRLINGQGEQAPLKNVVDIMPMETDTLEFYAHTEGDWFFHCHILYHMMSGMGRVISYTPQQANPLLPDPKKARSKLEAEDRMFYLSAENDFATNGNDGFLLLQNTRWRLGTEWRLGYNAANGYETETHLGRYIGRMQWLMPFVGFDWRYRKLGRHEVEQNIFGQKNTKDNRVQLSVGAQYTLPLLLQLQAELYTDGNVRVQLMREDIPLTTRLRMRLMVNTDKEYMAGLKYIMGRYWAFSAHYDSDMGFGAGITLSY